MFVTLFCDLGSIINIVIVTRISLTFYEINSKFTVNKNPDRWYVRTYGVFAIFLKIMSPVSWMFETHQDHREGGEQRHER